MKRNIVQILIEPAVLNKETGEQRQDLRARFNLNECQEVVRLHSREMLKQEIMAQVEKALNKMLY